MSLPCWFGLPGLRHSIGLALWWHFSFGLLWIINGVVLYALLFSMGQWVRLVPTSLDVFPNAASTALQYLSLTFPEDESWTRYNRQQQLSYFITVFVAAPVAVSTEVSTTAFAAKSGSSLSLTKKFSEIVELTKWRPVR